MSARIPPGFAELWLSFNTPGDPEPMLISLGLDLEAGEVPDGADVQRMLAAWTAAIDDHISSGYNLGAGYILIGQDGGDIRVDSTGTSSAGVTVSAGLPPNCCYLVRKLTASGGRRNRGRLFVPGPPESDFDTTGTMTTTQQGLVQSDWNDVFTALNADPQIAGLVLLHSQAPFTPTEITGFQVQQKLATQRRRMRP